MLAPASWQVLHRYLQTHEAGEAAQHAVQRCGSPLTPPVHMPDGIQQDRRQPQFFFLALQAAAHLYSPCGASCLPVHSRSLPSLIAWSHTEQCQI